MIDLMTDKSPEKQKYGIAMFEYPARKGKVPVEFLTAQIDYAKTAENHELLPMRARPQALGQDGPVSAVNAAVVL